MIQLDSSNVIYWKYPFRRMCFPPGRIINKYISRHNIGVRVVFDFKTLLYTRVSNYYKRTIGMNAE